MDLLIAKALESDLDAIETLYDELTDYLETHINYPGWMKGVYPTRVEAAHFFQTNCLYAAKIDGRIVGSFALSQEPEKAPDNGSWLIDAEDNEVFVIHVFAVHPDDWGQGIASAMLRFAEETGRTQRIKSIRLDVYEKNSAAIRTYEKNGFAYIDTVDLGLGHYGLDWFRLYEKVILPAK